MRRILPLKPASSNSQVPNSSSESVQRDKGKPKQKSSGCGKDESGVVDCHGKDNLKGLKENSLGAKLRREHLSPVRRPFPSGEENLPFIRDSKPKVNAKHVREHITLQKGSRLSTSGSSIFSTASSSQRNFKSPCDVRSSFTGDGYNFLHGIQSASCGVASDSHVEGGAKKPVKKNSKILWTKRSASTPKDHPDETNKAEIQISPKSNTPQVPKAPKRLFGSFLAKDLNICTNRDKDKSTLGEPQENSRDGDEPNRSSDHSSLIIISEEVPVEADNTRGLVRTPSVRSLTDSNEPFSKLTGNTSPKQSGLAILRGTFSSAGESVADKLSFRCQSDQAAAKNLARTLPENCKSHLANTNCLEMKKPFDWQTITEDEDRVRVATEVSVSATLFLNTHSSFSEEESSSFNFLEHSPIGRQSFSSENHWTPGNSITGTSDTSSQRGRFERSLANLSSNKEDTGRFRMWCEVFHKFEDDDDNLKKRAREAEEQAQLLSKEMELMKSYRSGPTQKGALKKAEVNVDLKQKLKNLCEEKMNLLLEVASQIRSRLSDRAAANEAFKLLSGEIKSYVKMAEKEKCAVKLSLENELDRQSREWGATLEKIKLNEKKMRDRLRDLAEQNVELQREISYLSNKESELKSRLRESEVHTDDFKTRLKDAENEILMLRKSLEKSHNQTREAEDDQHLIRRSYDLKEKENYALQKSIIRLQRLCKDQERTITGLCKGLNDEIDDIPQEKNDHITKLQDELLRVTGEEKVLCKDLRNCRSETDALGPENVCIIGIQKSKEEDNGCDLIKVDEELRARLDELQSQALSLLDENSTICAKLLGVIKYNIYYSGGLGTNEAEEAMGVLSMEQERNIVVEHEMNLQRLKRKAETLRKSVHMVKGILREKTIISCNHTLGQDMDKSDMLQSENCSSEAKEHINELQHELKAETIISRILREKMCSREFEVEQLQEDVAKLKESRKILEAEISRLQDLLSTARHKTRDLEYQLEVEEERNRFLEAGFQRNIQEQAVLREELTNVSKERDAVQQQTERMGWERSEFADIWYQYKKTKIQLRVDIEDAASGIFVMKRYGTERRT
ncbi:hypothetical protein SUGI_0002830 [Cryptomeria japonica]|nr:hypothetical protein SUGI_0002830 [Cryptomeria japonica]